MSLNDWCKDIVTNFIGALFGFGFSLLIYYAQNIKDKNKSERQVFEEHLDQLSYYAHLLSELLTSYRGLITSLRAYITEQRKDLMNVTILTHTPSNDMARAKTVDSRGVYESYSIAFKSTDVDWIKKYTKLNAALDFIDGASQEIHRINMSHLETSYRIQLKIKVHIETLGDKLQDVCVYLAQQHGPNRFQIPEYNLLNNSLLQYNLLIEQRASINEFHDKFVEPLLLQLHANFNLEPFAQPLMLTCKQVRTTMSDLRYEMNHVIGEFEKFPLASIGAMTRIRNEAKKIKSYVKSQSN
ncbi:MAG: hypothetical protein L6Q81_00365 [Bacteroidia bacterium]|nr:hypothetical protein [Bacteroidia bacterium]